MRKSRTVIKDIQQEHHQLLIEQVGRFFDLLEDLEVQIPSWANTSLLMVYEDRPVLEFLAFEDAQEFFLYYTRRMIERPPQFSFHCFSIDPVTGMWKSFVPPTLIGPTLKTKFRF